MRVVILLSLLNIPLKWKPMRLRYWEARQNFICDKQIVGLMNAYKIARVSVFIATNFDVRGK